MTDLNKIVMTKDQMAGYIDKTAVLKKNLEAVSSIYIEGAAASGKTTAVRMLVSESGLGRFFWHDFSMEEEEETGQILKEALLGQYVLIVLDRLDLCRDSAFFKDLEKLIRNPGEKKVILISREKPSENLVRLIWEDRMRIIPQEVFAFTLDDIRELGCRRGVFVNPREFMEETGGWPGCVSLCMQIMAAMQESGRENAGEAGEESSFKAHPVRSRVLHRIRHRNEVETFIDGEILGSLCSEGRNVMRMAMACAWISKSMCESCLAAEDAGGLLEDLRRKGLLRPAGEGRYQAEKLFKGLVLKGGQPWKSYGSWYERNGHFKEAYTCLYRYVFEGDEGTPGSDLIKTSAEEKKADLDAFLCAHYDVIPFFGEDYRFVLEDERKEHPFIFLRGMCRYQMQDFGGFQTELQRASRLKGHEGQEVYLNLLYADVRISAREFLSRCQKLYSSEKEKKYRLFAVTGSSFYSLCSPRDLSSLFACKKRGEDTYAGIWRSVFGTAERQIYSMARLDYSIETNRISRGKEEALKILNDRTSAGESSQILLYRLLLLCKLAKQSRDEDYSERIDAVRTLLYESPDAAEADLGEALFSLYAGRRSRLDLLSEWVRRHDGLLTETLNEKNYLMFFILLKSLVLLGRYDKTLGPAARLAEYLAAFKRHRMLSEVLFIQALARFRMGEKGTALRSTIESFAEGGAFRYVRFYTDYGNLGKQVLDQFLEWHEAQNPDKWKRKRKYDYRSVVNMPESDYIYTVVRAAGREDSSSGRKQLSETERLTMTEMVVIQSLSRGLTNEQIAGELNLKVTTVKSHLYSIYKKMGVKNRMEAVVRAGEMKIL